MTVSRGRKRLGTLRHARSFSDTSRSASAIALSVGRTPPARVTAFWSTLTSHDQSAALATLAQVRVHVLAGTKDRIIPLYAVRDMVAQIPGARLHLAHGVGHTLPRVHLQAVSRLLSLLLRYKPRPVAHV